MSWDVCIALWRSGRDSILGLFTFQRYLFNFIFRLNMTFSYLLSFQVLNLLLENFMLFFCIVFCKALLKRDFFFKYLAKNRKLLLFSKETLLACTYSLQCMTRPVTELPSHVPELVKRWMFRRGCRAPSHSPRPQNTIRKLLYSNPCVLKFRPSSSQNS